ncbi:MAG: ATP-binding protein [Terriglobia bacterium]
MSSPRTLTDGEELAFLRGRVAELEKLAAELPKVSAALEENRRLFDSFLSHAASVAWLKDELGRYVFANRRFQEVVPQAAGSCIGRTDRELWPAAVAERIRNNDVELKDTVETVPTEFGERRFRVRRFPFRTASGRLYSGGIGPDITGEKATLARLYHSAVNGVMECSGERIVGANETLPGWLGYTREEMLSGGLNWRAMTPERFRERDDEALAELRATGAFKPYEKEFLARDGKLVPVVVGGSELGARHGSFLFFILKLGEQEQMEGRLLRSQKLESLGVIAGGVAHDFNNLLATIMGNANLAQDALPREHPVFRYVNDVVVASRRASDLTQQVLAYSGRAHVSIKAVDLSRAVREIGSLLGTTISKKIELRFELSPELPTIDADEGQLQQIIMNLVINASDAIGEQPGEILVRTWSDHGVCFEVRDTGCGMDEETKARIFDPFFTTKSNGRGLGLAAVLGIVRKHEGTLVVGSESGVGTTFRVTFPAGKIQAPRSPQTALRDYRGTETILVADDDEAIQRMTKIALERLGYKVLVAVNGQDAVDVFREHSNEIAVILIDWAMPVMNGEEAIACIFDMDPNAKTILSSGYAEADSLQRAGLATKGFLQKPYTTTRLALTLRDVIDGMAPVLNRVG